MKDIGQRADEHRELVAAQARDDVGRFDGRPQAMTDVRNHEVARLVSEALVDVLEAIEVDDKHRE